MVTTHGIKARADTWSTYLPHGEPLCVADQSEVKKSLSSCFLAHAVAACSNFLFLRHNWTVAVATTPFSSAHFSAKNDLDGISASLLPCKLISCHKMAASHSRLVLKERNVRLMEGCVFIFLRSSPLVLWAPPVSYHVPFSQGYFQPSC